MAPPEEMQLKGRELDVITGSAVVCACEQAVRLRIGGSIFSLICIECKLVGPKWNNIRGTFVLTTKKYDDIWFARQKRAFVELILFNKQVQSVTFLSNNILLLRFSTQKRYIFVFG